MKHFPDPYGILEDLKSQEGTTSYFFMAIVVIITTALGSALGSAVVVLSTF